MRHFSKLAALAGVLASASFVSAQVFTATLNGAQEVRTPAVVTPATGFGTISLTGGPGAFVATYSVTYSGLTAPIASPFAHIHNAPAGSNGAIIHDLDGANLAPIAGSTSGTINGDWRFDDASKPLTDALVAQLLAGNLYFNIHTTAFASGEIRGQIIPEPAALTTLLAPIALLARRRR